MTTVAPGTVLSQLQWRAATKKFDPARRIPADLWRSLEDAAVLAPSSFGLQPWKFVVVTDARVREELRGHSWNQPQITEASHLVVFCRRAETTDADVDRLMARVAEVRGVDRSSLDGYRSMISGFIVAPGMRERTSDWNARQVYVALGMFLSACAMVGVDACPMEGIDAAAYDRVLGLPQAGYLATVVATAGYRRADDPANTQKKVRFAHEQVVRHV